VKAYGNHVFKRRNGDAWAWAHDPWAKAVRLPSEHRYAVDDAVSRSDLLKIAVWL